MVTKEQIIAFIKVAHANSWPEGVTAVKKPGLYEFDETFFSQGKWDFYDLFGGMVTDIGFEVIYYEKEPVWGAAYRGGVISTKIDPDDIFNFLILALKAENDNEFPLRGPSVFNKDGDSRWLYLYQFSGNFYSFIGVEKILFKNEIVYERALIGGGFGSGLYGSPIPLFTQMINEVRKSV